MTSQTSRRAFLKTAAVSTAAAQFLLETQSMNGNPLNLPIGLQLYTVGQEMDADPSGTLKQVAAAGYRDVELSPLSKTPPKELRSALDDVGLKNSSGHYMLAGLMSNLQEQIDLAKLFGHRYTVVTVHNGFTPRTTLMDHNPIRALYVEQEPPFTEMPALEAIKVDYSYLKNLHS